jgi:hypothetical protein
MMAELRIPTLHVLLAENEEPLIEQWETAVEYHNTDAEKHGFRIQTLSEKSVSSAMHALEMHRFDAVIVDLRLDIESGVAENNTTGNDLVRHLIVSYPVGVLVNTGQPKEAEDYGCPQVKVVDKATGWSTVIDWLVENKDVFLELRTTKSTFNRQTAGMFFRNIWPRWRHWKADGSLDAAGLSSVLVRHVVAHVHDSLLNLGGGAVHPEEAYFVPPLKGTLDTGDMLFDEEGGAWIIVTPRCDLAHVGKTATVLLASCEDIASKWNELIAAGTENARKQQDKLTQHNGSHKQHFLLPLRDLRGDGKGPWMVQFQNLKVMTAEEAFTNLPDKRFASLSPMYVPSLVERFGAYFSRIGTPGVSSN